MRILSSFTFQQRYFRWMLIALILMILSYVINATYRIGQFPSLFENSHSVMIWILTMPLLLGYAECISRGYAKSETQTIQSRMLRISLLFVGICLLHASIVQTLLLLVTDGDIWIWETAYLRRDFPYFALPVLAYMWLAYDREAWRIGTALVVQKARLDLLESWKKFRGTHALLAHIRETVEPLSSHMGVPDIRWCDVVLIKSLNKSFLVYLSNGEKLVFTFPISAIDSPLFERWFMKVKDRHYVNMLYVDLMTSDYGQLVLDEIVQNAIAETVGEKELRSMLKPSRHFEGNLKTFLQERNLLPTEGWEEPVVQSIKAK